MRYRGRHAPAPLLHPPTRALRCPRASAPHIRTAGPPEMEPRAALLAAAAACLVLASCLPPVAGHGFMFEPKARNVIHNSDYCPHCLAAGGECAACTLCRRYTHRLSRSAGRRRGGSAAGASRAPSAQCALACLLACGGGLLACGGGGEERPAQLLAWPDPCLPHCRPLGGVGGQHPGLAGGRARALRRHGQRPQARDGCAGRRAGWRCGLAGCPAWCCSFRGVPLHPWPRAAPVRCPIPPSWARPHLLLRPRPQLLASLHHTTAAAGSPAQRRPAQRRADTCPASAPAPPPCRRRHLRPRRAPGLLRLGQRHHHLPADHRQARRAPHVPPLPQLLPGRGLLCRQRAAEVGGGRAGGSVGWE